MPQMIQQPTVGQPLTLNLAQTYQIVDQELGPPRLENGLIISEWTSLQLANRTTGQRIAGYRCRSLPAVNRRGINAAPMVLNVGDFICTWANPAMTAAATGGAGIGTTTSRTTAARARSRAAGSGTR